MSWHVYKSSSSGNYFIKRDEETPVTYEPYCKAPWVAAFPTLALAQAFTAAR